MLYAIAHFLRDKISWLWRFVECINAWFFSLRYGKKLKEFSFSKLPKGYEVTPMRNVHTDKIVEFFSRQSEDAFKFFKPHGFDVKSIKSLQRNRAFLGYVLQDSENGNIAGYCFNRCFFYGVGYRGRMVDVAYRGKGLGTAMNKLLNEVGFGIGLRLFETVSKDNVASYRSALSSSKVKVVKEMPRNELFLEILPE